MITAMGNFSGDCIALMREDGKPFQFSPERYKEVTGLTVPRLYLLTKNEDDSDSDEEESFPSAFGDHDASFGTKGPSSPSFPKEDGLIGTSSERQQFFDDLDQELRASLVADKAKVKSREQQQLISESTNDETDSLEWLRQVREQRSPPEPNSSEPRVKVSVRHCTLGVVSRVFDPEGSMQGVYDWIGSLSKTPEHFLLVTFPSTTLYPDEKVVKVKDTVINMTETTEPVPLSKDEEDVYFQDGRGLEHGYDDTVWDENEFCSSQSPRQQGLPVTATHSTYEIDPVNINPPVHLLANEDDPKSDNNLSLEEKIQLHVSKLQAAKIVIVDRHDVVNELLALYSNKDILDCKLSVSFADDNALGDGVLREVYSVFWDSFFARFCEGSRQFAVIPNPSLSDENYETLGRIITHQLVLTGTFPIQLAEVQVLHALFGQVSDDRLVNSFLQILPERERQILSKAMDGKDPFPTNEIVDILSAFNASSLPSRSNLQKILRQVSVSELIHKPFFILSKMRQGMGDFWNGVAKDEIEELYRKASPDPKNVVSRLDFKVQDKKEEQVSGWLVRFLKGANPKVLGQFLRFCTGTDILLPGKRIQVRFESMSELAMRPKSKTCFCSLMLSKNYNSFTHFSSNLEFYLANTSFWDLRDYVCLVYLAIVVLHVFEKQSVQIVV